MEKDDAIIYIQAELDKGRSLQEITHVLSQKLGVSPQVVSKFVARIAASYQPEFSFRSENYATGVTETPGIPTSPQAEALAYSVAPASVIHDEWKETLPTSVASDSSQSNAPSRNTIYPDPETEQWLLQSLLKGHSEQDILLILCDRNELDWKQAQRLLAQVRSKNSQLLNRKRNRILLIMILGSIVVGLVVLISSISEIVFIFQAIFAPQSLPPDQMVIIDANTIIASVLGLGLFSGGVYGLLHYLNQNNA
jgi:hypothetical protein